ncbi:hypothetical protein [Pseudomonas amygdali]|uniref:hypothetical protein n=1 Tax=Pseudomonas amygdali TaxID=47877 RepID=UPI000EFE808D|nr:hypothetical protein [Pseudomonas amygdali]RMV80737.1 hypothetical protein ALP04_04143 [Pseudomonas amygdali pv. sesami]
MKGFVKAMVVCVGLAGSVHAVAADIQFMYKILAPTDLANLKGCGKGELYDGYLSSLRKGLEVAPEIDHKRIPEFMKSLQAKVDMEYHLMGYKAYDEYEASGKPGPNPSAVVREGCEEGVSEALKNRIKINELSMKALGAR